MFNFESSIFQSIEQIFLKPSQAPLSSSLYYILFCQLPADNPFPIHMEFLLPILVKSPFVESKNVEFLILITHFIKKFVNTFGFFSADNHVFFKIIGLCMTL